MYNAQCLTARKFDSRCGKVFWLSQLKDIARENTSLSKYFDMHTSVYKKYRILLYMY